MRYKSYNILYLVIILIYLLRPLLPYFEYVINRDYIEKNLCVEKDDPENTCHGKCYLHEQLNKQSEPQDTDRNDGRKIISENKLDDHLKEFSSIPVIFGSKLTLSGYYSVPSTVRFISGIFVPPKNITFHLVSFS